MGSLLWVVVAVLFVLWLIGLVVRVGGKLIHLLFVGAIILIIVNMLR